MELFAVVQVAEMGFRLQSPAEEGADGCPWLHPVLHAICLSHVHGVALLLDCLLPTFNSQVALHENQGSSLLCNGKVPSGWSPFENLKGARSQESDCLWRPKHETQAGHTASGFILVGFAQHQSFPRFSSVPGPNALTITLSILGLETDLSLVAAGPMWPESLGSVSKACI